MISLKLRCSSANSFITHQCVVFFVTCHTAINYCPSHPRLPANEAQMVELRQLRDYWWWTPLHILLFLKAETDDSYSWWISIFMNIHCWRTLTLMNANCLIWLLNVNFWWTLLLIYKLRLTVGSDKLCPK